MRLIIWETGHVWSTAFRWAMMSSGGPDGARWEVRVVRGERECREQLEEQSASVLAVELAGEQSGEQAVQRSCFLAEVQQHFPDSLRLALGLRAATRTAALCRELGMHIVVPTIRDLSPVMKSLRRHAANVKQQEEHWKERVWRRMPWQPISE